MSYYIDTSTKLIRVVYEGTLENKDILGVFKEALMTEGEELNLSNRLEDMRKLKGIAIGFEELEDFTENIRTIQLPKTVKSAILTSNPFQYGTARIFQTILEHPKIKVAIFSNEEEAHNWLSAMD